MKTALTLFACTGLPWAGMKQFGWKVPVLGGIVMGFDAWSTPLLPNPSDVA